MELDVKPIVEAIVDGKPVSLQDRLRLVERYSRVEKQSEVITCIVNVFASYCRSIISICNSASECADRYEKVQQAFQILSAIIDSPVVIPRLVRSVFFELVVNPKRDLILDTVCPALLDQHRYVAMIHDLDPDDSKGICSTFLCNPLHDYYLHQLKDLSKLPTLLAEIDSWKERLPHFEEWKHNLIIQLSSDDIRSAFSQIEPFPFTLCSSLYYSLSQSSQLVLIEMCETAAEAMLQSPSYREQVLSILQNCKQILGPRLNRLLRLPSVLETVELMVHEELSKNRLSDVIDGLFLFQEERQKDVETLYYALFVLRWCQQTMDRDIEQQALLRLQSMISASAFASMNQIRELEGHLINTALLSPFLGNPAYRYDAGSRDDRSYEIQGEYGHVTLEYDGMEIHCCPAQAKLLLLFEEDTISMNQLIALSPFQPSVTRLILQSLTCCESTDEMIRLVISKETIHLPSLASPPSLQSLASLLSPSIETDSLIDDETNLSCHVMRVMKQKKRLSEQALLHALEKTRSVDRATLKHVLDVLIEKEYLIRDPRNECILSICYVC